MRRGEEGGNGGRRGGLTTRRSWTTRTRWERGGRGVEALVLYLYELMTIFEFYVGRALPSD